MAKYGDCARFTFADLDDRLGISIRMALGPV